MRKNFLDNFGARFLIGWPAVPYAKHQQHQQQRRQNCTSPNFTPSLTHTAETKAAKKKKTFLTSR
jgi:hypothetical protein